MKEIEELENGKLVFHSYDNTYHNNEFRNIDIQNYPI